MKNPLFDVIRKDGHLNASHVLEAARSLYPDKVILKSAGGKDRVCRCARILLWEDLGDSYRAVCVCGQVYWDSKPKTEAKR